MFGSCMSRAEPVIGIVCGSYCGLTRNSHFMPASRKAFVMSSQYPGTAFSTRTPLNVGGVSESHSYGW